MSCWGAAYASQCGIRPSHAPSLGACISLIGNHVIAMVIDMFSHGVTALPAPGYPGPDIVSPS